MAFQQQSTRQPAQRVNFSESGDDQPAALAPQHPTAPPNESQTWVLFTPGTDAGTTTSYLTGSVHDGQITPGRSRISDLGSLDTVPRSGLDVSGGSEVIAESSAEEDAELDSLDSHLPEFRSVPSPYSHHHPHHHQTEVPHATPVLPGHDGLGSFRFESPGMSAEVQDRMYAFERFNPNRVRHTRTDSFSLAQLDIETEEAQDRERNRRIEAWRLEQSQLLLDDIRNETKRRRQSQASLRKVQSMSRMPYEPSEMSLADEEAADINLNGADWHDQDEPVTHNTRTGTDTSTEPGTWSRLARKVICDLMGIDDQLLSILFGEALPDEEMLSSTPKASTFAAPSHMASESSHDSEWQLRMLDRISRELGVLVHQMSSHPGAFSTYNRVQQMPLPYAGLPVIPETPADASETGRGLDGSSSISAMPRFQPTVPRPVETFSSRPSEPASHQTSPTAAGVTHDTQQSFTQKEWEQDLDIRLVFRYLRSRFTSSRQAAPSAFSSSTSHLATSSTQDAAAKAARVRQHHPLVSHAHSHGYHHHHHHHLHHHHHHHRPRPVERRSFKISTTPAAAAAAGKAGSCASQSTRRSARRSSISSRPSSRHYWDIGGSIGTGSVIAGTGPMGSWGEV
ncbi:uncharacterized protein C8A04DRAFT_14778 [Dichotomopilus funicola]|uniref:Uncharacterized protein n=1 Tax=Dichotomopilus funicola TaxID=1934379 RepID=A0AAN6UWP6_9PEZI|nr:hypothetical protein C8A04DRAFT_14778 [Dichotomopilus funicola]